jgi:transposase
MDVLYEVCCGLDVHQATVVACVRRPGPRGRRASEVRTYGATTGQLLELVDWLADQRVTHVAMESTGVLWKPVFNLLEDHFTVLLVNARHVKAVPGRKTDVKDCAWLAELLEHGLLRPSFIPPRPIRDLRDLTRRRRTLVEQRAHEINRVHKLLEAANVKLGLVVADLLGASSRAMLRALQGGERDGTRLAELAKGTLRRKRGPLAAALTGRFTEHHAFLLGELLDHIEYLEATIARLGERIELLLRPYVDQVERLQTIPGVNRLAAETLVAEIGVDMGRFPTAGHLASWAGMCPGNHESAGKRLRGTTRHGDPWLKTLLVECGWSAGRRRESYLRAQYTRLSHRRGRKKAAMAVGHSILVAAYHILRDGTTFRDLGADHFDRLARERLTRHYLRRLEQLGHHVVLDDPPDAA